MVAVVDLESGLPPAMEVDKMDADADGNAEVECGVEAELLEAVAATSRNRTVGEEEGDGEGEAVADADAELLEAVDASEANSNSSHWWERMRMKFWVKSVVYWQIGHLVAIHTLF